MRRQGDRGHFLFSLIWRTLLARTLEVPVGMQTSFRRTSCFIGYTEASRWRTCGPPRTSAPGPPARLALFHSVSWRAWSCLVLSRRAGAAAAVLSGSWLLHRALGLFVQAHHLDAAGVLASRLLPALLVVSPVFCWSVSLWLRGWCFFVSLAPRSCVPVPSLPCLAAISCVSWSRSSPRRPLWKTPLLRALVRSLTRALLRLVPRPERAPHPRKSGSLL